MRDEFRKKYTQQKSNASQRGIPFLITLEQWKQVWLDSGKWEQRGKGAAKYCMCRVGDKGAYEVGNVFIQLGRINVSEGNVGKLDSDETKHKKSAALTGMPHPWSAGKNNHMHRPEVKSNFMEAVSKGEKHYRSKVTMTPYGFFKTASEAAVALGIPKPTVNWRCKFQKPEGWAYI